MALTSIPWADSRREAGILAWAENLGHDLCLMNEAPSDDSSSGAGKGSFPTTHWSAMLAAGYKPGAKVNAALGELCATYWYPLYAFARRNGRRPADAQDLTQGFFAHLIEKQLVHRVDPRKGRFRSFLLGCFKVFLASEHERAHSQRRGGGILIVPLDSQEAERRFGGETPTAATPEELFDRHWAVAALDAALARLELEMRQSGRAVLFEKLLPGLQGDEDGPSYAEIARGLGTTEGTIKVTIHRLRQRYREILRAVVAQTVNDPMDVETELAQLMAALRS